MKITEHYVSFEVAKLLKEKGFDEKCRASYNKDGNFHLHKSCYFQLECGSGYLGPTLQMACKWLREEHNLMISINFSYIFNSYTYSIKYITKCELVYAGTTESYEEAVESALKYVLENLI